MSESIIGHDRWGDVVRASDFGAGPAPKMVVDAIDIVHVEIWVYPDPSVWCRGHQASCGGHRWVPSTPEVRAAHPDGHSEMAYVDACCGAHPIH